MRCTIYYSPCRILEDSPAALLSCGSTHGGRIMGVCRVYALMRAVILACKAGFCAAPSGWSDTANANVGMDATMETMAGKSVLGLSKPPSYVLPGAERLVIGAVLYAQDRVVANVYFWSAFRRGVKPAYALPRASPR